MLLGLRWTSRVAYQFEAQQDCTLPWKGYAVAAAEVERNYACWESDLDASAEIEQHLQTERSQPVSVVVQEQRVDHYYPVFGVARFEWVSEFAAGEEMEKQAKQS